jgi:excisionase family DNA binding protein
LGRFDGLKVGSGKEQANSPSLLGDALLDVIRQAVKEAMWEANGNGHAANSPETSKEEQQHLKILAAAKTAVEAGALLTAEQLAVMLDVPLSWVYEQSRQGKIPTHHLGRYIRFDLQEVLASQKKS